MTIRTPPTCKWNSFAPLSLISKLLFRGAGKNKTKAALESKRFVAKTSHHIDFLVDSEATRTYHMKPQRRPACEIAMEGGSKFKTAKKKSIQISRELLIEEKRRLSALAPLESVDCSTVKRNLPGYTGHEPQSPKNARGPYLPHTMSTAGYANAVGLGLS